jgi:hypothetical protein
MHKLMSQRIEVSSIGLVNEYYKGLLPQIFYTRIDSQNQIIEGRSSGNFINSRTALLDEFINIDKSKHHEMSQTYLAEQLVRIAIKNPLEERGFFMDIAPQNLEHGDNQKGVDLIVVDSNKMICLGIDLKFKKRVTRLDRDGFGWCQNTLSPFIYLKMGNWSLDTREESGIGIRRWIQEYTSPKLKTTGKIPRVFELRQYVIPRIIRTLEGYIDVINDPSDRLYNTCTPKDNQSFELLKSKLLTIHSVFLSIFQDYRLEKN